MYFHCNRLLQVQPTIPLINLLIKISPLSHYVTQANVFFFRRYRSSALHTRYYDGLRYIRQRIFRLQSRRRTAKTSLHRGKHHIQFQVYQASIHLFTNCTVNTRITRMQTHNVLVVPCFITSITSSRFILHCYKFQHCLLHIPKARINKRTGINNNICIFQKFFFPRIVIRSARTATAPTNVPFYILSKIPSISAVFPIIPRLFKNIIAPILTSLLCFRYLSILFINISIVLVSLIIS